MSRRIEVLARPKQDIMEKCPYRTPEYLLPDTFLPVWRRLPLYSKIPAKTNPDDPVVFARPRLTKPLYQTFERKDFDWDSRLDLPLDYNPLHDPNLRTFFCCNLHHYQKLVKKGFVDPFKNNVSCTQKEFNEYRAYMRSIIVQQEHLRRINDERILKLQIEQEMQDEENKRRSKPLDWFKKQLNKRKKHKIRTVGELGIGIKQHCQSSDVQDDEYLTKFLKKREFLNQEESTKRELNQQEILRELRHVTAAWRNAEKKVKKDEKATETWMKLEKEELKKMQIVDDALKEYNDEFQQRVAQHEKRHEKLWKRYERSKNAKKMKRAKSVSNKDVPETPEKDIIEPPIHTKSTINEDACGEESYNGFQIEDPE